MQTNLFQVHIARTMSSKLLNHPCRFAKLPRWQQSSNKFKGADNYILLREYRAQVLLMLHRLPQLETVEIGTDCNRINAAEMLYLLQHASLTLQVRTA